MYVSGDRFPNLGFCLQVLQVEGFRFQMAKKRLYASIIPAVTRSRHAWLDPVFQQCFLEPFRCKVGASITMEYKLLYLLTSNSVLEGLLQIQRYSGCLPYMRLLHC